MDSKTFDLLCEASQFSFRAEEKEEFMQIFNSMIEFVGTVKQYDCVYNPDEGINRISMSDLREDSAQASYPPEKLLENTEALFDCYVIPKIME